MKVTLGKRTFLSRTGVALILAVILTLMPGVLLPLLTQQEAVLLISVVVVASVTTAHPGFLPLALYSVVLIVSTGLVTLASLATVGPVNGNDMLWGLLLGVTVPLYFSQRRNLDSLWFRRLELSWLIIAVVVAVEALRSPALTVSERVDNLHTVEGFLMFFPTVAIVSTRRRLRYIAVLGALIAIAGTALTVAQSLYGLQNITSSPFYDTGGWPGNKQMVGAIARVNLPVSDWVAFVLVTILGAGILRFRGWYVPLAGFLSLTILLNFARSLWLGMAAALLAEVAFLLSVGRIQHARAFRLVLVPISLAFALWLAPYIGLQGITDALSSRVDEGLFFVQSDTGTFAVRQVQNAAGLSLWGDNLLLGVGTGYFTILGFYLDVGVIETLVSMGLLGLVVLVYVLVVNGLAAFAALRKATGRDSLIPTVLSVGVLSQLVLMIMYRQLAPNPRTFTILGIASALMVVAASQLFASVERSQDAEAPIGVPEQQKSATRSPFPTATSRGRTRTRLAAQKGSGT